MFWVWQTSFHNVFSFQSVNQEVDVVVTTKDRRGQLQPVDLMLIKTACCDTVALVYVPRTVIDTVEGPVKCALQCMETTLWQYQNLVVVPPQNQ